jgi:hypothetical protein
MAREVEGGPTFSSWHRTPGFSSHFKLYPIKCVQPAKLRDQSTPVTEMVRA